MADLVETAVNADFLNTLVKALQAANLVDMLKSPDSFTIFAPTDDAFAKLPEGTLDSLLKDLPILKRVLMYHVAYGDVRSDDLIQIDHAETLEGSIVAIQSTDGKIMVNNANVLKTDLIADNGVIHVIDTVLMPAIIAGE